MAGTDAPLMDEFCVLVDRCLAGNQQAIMELVDRHQGPVFGLCLRMLRHRQDAEDMAQETFVRAMRSLIQWDRHREFLPWLLAIAANRCRTLLSRRMRRPATTGLVESLPDTSAAEEPARRLAEELNLALATVREEYRRSFLLFHQAKLSYAEISAAMNRPVGTIKTWVHRARRELIEEMTQRGALAEVRDAMRPV
jgi:RNA polymerase sigma-70 factor (ECF subfamily)